MYFRSKSSEIVNLQHNGIKMQSRCDEINIFFSFSREILSMSYKFDICVVDSTVLEQLKSLKK